MACFVIITNFHIDKFPPSILSLISGMNSHKSILLSEAGCNLHRYSKTQDVWFFIKTTQLYLLIREIVSW